MPHLRLRFCFHTRFNIISLISVAVLLVMKHVYPVASLLLKPRPSSSSSSSSYFNRITTCSRKASSSSVSCSITRWRRCRSLYSLSVLNAERSRGVPNYESTSSAVNNNDPLVEYLLPIRVLEEEIYSLAGSGSTNDRFNINSNQQVAYFIFGDKNHSASRQTIVDFILKTQGNDFDFWTNDEFTDDRRRIKLAEKVLEYRILKSELRKTNKKLFTNKPDPQIEAHRSFSTVSNSQENQQSPLRHLFLSSSKISPYWDEKLQTVEKSTSKNLLQQLDACCPMGYDPYALPSGAIGIRRREPEKIVAGKKGSLLSYVREQKERFPEKIILTKVGEFYEAFGIDAIMLVEHCGLNPMGDKARAGCPAKNIQATLDCLTNRGFGVAVYEEASDTDSSTGKGASGGSKSRLKRRFLGQIVSLANPLYMYDLVMSSASGFTSTPSRPYVGVLSTSKGYTYVEISLEERTVRVCERLTAESVACHISAFPPTGPLFYMPPAGEVVDGERKAIPFLPSRMDTSYDGIGSRLRIHRLNPILVKRTSADSTDVEQSKKLILSELLPLCNVDDESKGRLFKEDFILLETNSTGMAPLSAETANQLGLMNDPCIPSLVNALLAEHAPVSCRRFLRRWLINPPPPGITNEMATLLSSVINDSPSFPPFNVPPIGKVLSLIHARQASAQVFRDICISLQATISTLDVLQSIKNSREITMSLMRILEYESGLGSCPNQLRVACEECLDEIRTIVIDEGGPLDEISNFEEIVPTAFFERNEVPWRGRVRQDVISKDCDEVSKAAKMLSHVISKDFVGSSLPTDGQKGVVLQDIFNNMLAIKEKPVWTHKGAESYYHPKDRKGKVLKNRFTTARVEEALLHYIETCENAKDAVNTALSTLSSRLSEGGFMPTIVQSAHANLILSTVTNHALAANSKGWNIIKCNSDETHSYFKGVWPYWLDKSIAVQNTFKLDGMWVLTAPNMSGKSTIMRSTAAAALLTNCGLCSPLEEGHIKCFDNIFVRGASADVPTEGKSAFGSEMNDIAQMLRQCGSESLIMVDEIGRGTSPKDGTSLAGAVLEEIASRGITGIFATHLHDVLKLPLKSSATSRISTKQMMVDKYSTEGVMKWTYKLEDGICSDSLALKTARDFGIPRTILERAAEFSAHRPPNDFQHSSTNTLDPDNSTKSFNLKTIADILLEIIPVKRRIDKIPAGWSPPPSLEGHSCVYVLEVGFKPDSAQYYVGETDSLSKRISQHRSKGGKWKNLKAIAVPVDNKSIARNIESRTILSLAQQGFDLISTHDGRSVSTLGKKLDQ